jgi:hypothetical protein
MPKSYRWVRFDRLKEGDVIDWAAGTDKAGDEPYAVRVQRLELRGDVVRINDEYEAPRDGETVVLSPAVVRRLRSQGYYL